MKPKILHLITGLEIGGAEKSLANTLPRMRNFEHIVCSLRNDGPIGKVLREQQIKTVHLGAKKGLGLSAVLSFYALIKNEKPDLLITYLIQADFFGRFFGRLFGIKKIYSFLRSSLEGPEYQKIFFFEKLTNFLVDGYFAVSEAVKDTYIKKAAIKPERIKVIPNGVEMPVLNSTPNAIRQKLGIPQNSLLISCVAQLRPEKNHFLLLSVFKKLRSYVPKCLLVLAGSGPLENKIREWTIKNQEQKNVRLVGNIKEIYSLLAVTDMFILLSSFEGMSNAILEALAVGCPIIASDIKPNREIIEQEKNGFLVSLENEKEIVNKLLLLVENLKLKETIKQNNLAKARLYSLENTTNLFTKAILEALNQPK